MKMKLITVLSGVLSLGAISAASAADMAVKARPVVLPDPVFDWSGFYIGIQGGWKDADHRIARLDAAGAVRIFNGVPLDDTNSASGGFIGGHAGYNIQSGMWVFGIEGDAEWTDAKYGPSTIRAAPGVDYNYGSIDWQATLRGRVGIAVAQRTLLYATGGLAYASINSRVDVGGLGNQFIAYRREVPGWVVGAGIEHAFTQNFTARVEGRYTEYDDIRQTSTAGATATFLTETKEWSVRGGLSYKFGGPVVAKY